MRDTLTLESAPDGSIRQLYERPGFLVRRAHQIVAALFEEVSRGAVTQTQFASLYVLRQRPRIDQITLAKLIGHDRSTTALVVKNLIADGLVGRAADDKDRRRNLLSLTEAGERRLAEAVEYARQTQSQILSPFDEEEARLLQSLLERLVNAFNDKIRAPIAPE